ncbi:SRPBCC family protein [Streptacidiphilus melanogenes]|uniref:SRPBCC family protein n=1 Tax=Streptacidiphilus melanogenes TaxID=411235 RepID=UPI0005A93F0B|nr:SRPBCC family protein [Streptacidiphilus melanogenes]
MEFSNEFRVSLPVEPAWDLFTDVERLVPCMPGAQLTETDGDVFHGTVKVRVGPVTVQYKGVASFEEVNAEDRTVRIKASGRDTHGQGNADAHVTVKLRPDGDGTGVTVNTRLSVTGKAAQFGKSVMEDISRKLIAQFVDCLESRLAQPQEAPSPPAEEQPAESGPVVEPGTAERAPAAGPEATGGSEAIDLLGLARGPVLKRFAPVALGGLCLLGLLLWLRRRRNCRKNRH